jgi:LPS export ABC transporter protein LptC
MKNAIVPILVILFLSCTFDYGETDPSERTLPDLVMENVEYVRIRSADPIARFQAERAERFEKQSLMKLKNFSFEQFGERGESVNVIGRAGFASINIESSDIFMDNGVRLEVESEDIIIVTRQIDWQDERRFFSAGEENEVNIQQQSGTSFTGVGLRADVRRRTWEFTGSAGGTFIHEDDEEEPEPEENVIQYNAVPNGEDGVNVNGGY